MSSKKNVTREAIAFPLVTIKQAISVCWLDDLGLVPVVWGPVGWTKSSTIKSLADDLGLPLHDVRLSDKEPTDLGGIPFPMDVTTPDGETRKALQYLVTSLLPFEDIYGAEYESILFFDEVDRTSVDVLNVALQLLLDKGVNGRKLCRQTRIVCAGNGQTDSGTTELTSAAATRLVHLFVDTAGPQALDHWIEWAHLNNVDSALIGFARFEAATFGGDKVVYMELQKPNPRTFTWAAAALDILPSLPYPPEVGDAIVYGLVGQLAGRQYRAYRESLRGCPTLEQVLRDPDNVGLPPTEFVGVVYALGQSYLRGLHTAYPAEGMSPEIDPEHTAKVATYFQRIVLGQPATREAVSWFFRKAGEKLPSLPGRPEYKNLVQY